jgi:flagellar motility protein MotE (MotC chaperone)
MAAQFMTTKPKALKLNLVSLCLVLFFLIAVGGVGLSANLVSPASAQEDAADSQTELSPDESKGEEATPEKVSLPGPVPGVNPETFRMIEMIEKKNRDLKRREAEIAIKEQRLQTLEQKIGQDLKKIEDAITRSQEQIGIQKNLIKKNVEGLIKAYSAMKPQEAATLLEALNEDLAIQILSGMKSKVAGKVFSKLDVKVAKNISEKLAGQRKTPPQK